MVVVRHTPPNADRPEPGAPSHSQPGYLFHVQKQPLRARRSGTPPPRSKHLPPDSKPGQHLFRTHVRTFSIVLAGMLLFLVAAILTASRSWQAKRTRTSSISVTQVGGDEEEATTYQIAIAGDDEETRRMRARSVTNTGPDLLAPDTDTIPRAMMFARRGDAMQAEGRYEEAAKLYRDALSIWPHLARVRGELGRLYLRLRQFDKAEESLERAIEADPGAGDLINDLGVVYFQQKRLGKAIELFNAAIRIDPAFASSYYNLVLCHVAMGDPAEAWRSLDRYLAIRPNDAKGLKEKAFLQAANNDYTNALATIEAALNSAPEWPALHLDAAAISALMGREEDALKHLAQAQQNASLATVYLVYQQPAFRDIRRSEAGKVFEKSLAAKAREMARESREQDTKTPGDEPELSAGPPS